MLLKGVFAFLDASSQTIFALGVFGLSHDVMTVVGAGGGIVARHNGRGRDGGGLLAVRGDGHVAVRLFRPYRSSGTSQKYVHRSTNQAELA